MSQELINKLVDLLREHHNKTGGHSGQYIPELVLDSGFVYKEVKQALGYLWKIGWVSFHDGAGGTLFKLKVKDGEH